MSDMNISGWPFSEDTSGEGLNISAIFGNGNPDHNANPFEVLTEQQTESAGPVTPPVPVQTAENTVSQIEETAVLTPAQTPAPAPAEPATPQPAPPTEESNPIKLCTSPRARRWLMTRWKQSTLW